MTFHIDTNTGSTTEVEPTTSGDTIENLYSYKFQKALWNSSNQYRVKDVACSGNMSCILTGMSGQLKKLILNSLNCNAW